MSGALIWAGSLLVILLLLGMPVAFGLLVSGIAGIWLTIGFVPMAGELPLVLGASGAFVLFYVLIGGPIGTMAEAAARSFF